MFNNTINKKIIKAYSTTQNIKPKKKNTIVVVKL